MGLNMPARTVIFTSVRKWDGETHRWMASGEYIQMSGRAGRRGKDDRGVTVMMVDDKIDAKICKEMVQGEASPLQSTFRLSYYSLLNLLSRSDGLYDTEYVISHSFHQFQHEKELPLQKKRVAELEALLANAKEAAARAAEEEKAKDVPTDGKEDASVVVDADVDVTEKKKEEEENFAHDSDFNCKKENESIDRDLRSLEIDILRMVLRPKNCLKFLTYVSLAHYISLSYTTTLDDGQTHSLFLFLFCPVYARVYACACRCVNCC